MKLAAALTIALLCATALGQNRATIATYCVPCHNARLAESKVALDSLDPDRPETDRDTWERALRQLRARTMPPVDNPRPDAKTYEALLSSLATSLDRIATPRVPPPTAAEQSARLASLLWNSGPDAALLQSTKIGGALQPQVRRMLADPKTAALIDNFFAGWLGLDQIATMPADAVAFPEFDAPLRQAFLQETRLFLASQLRDDRPAIEVWTANYTYVNDRLARHYGIPNITGPEFRRVTLPHADRAGLLGQGSFLIATSVLTKHAAVDAPSTSPATRAKWIRTHFFGVPVPHPIPGIPPLEKGILLSAQLRTLPDPSCNACHQNFFPLGYALENFDPLGRWRTEADREPIDASGALADGTEFSGPVELRRALVARQEAFLTTLTERLLNYAIDGKAGLTQATPADRMPAVRAILREAERSGYTWSGLLTALAKSPLSMMKASQ
ncbi:MAG TPA: DUF1592 domain-containing protein [Bryobacteraceae bacterium]